MIEDCERDSRQVAQCVKNNITKKTGPHTFASLEEKFFASCQNSHGTSQFKRTNGKTKKKHHARLPAQVPASSVPRSPGDNNRQERKDAVSGQKNRKHQADNRVGKQEHLKGKKSADLRNERRQSNGALGPIVPSCVWQNHVKASVNNT